MNKVIKTLIPLALLGGTLTGCSMYQSKAAPKSDFVGTYELEIYKSRHEMNSEEEPYDRKAEEGIEAYFTLDENGYGYYGYKDNETAARVDSVFSIYTHDEKEPELYKAIKLGDGVTEKKEWEWQVGCLDEPTMGFMPREKEIEEKGFLGITFKKKVTEYTLAYTIPQRHNKIMNKDIHYQYVCYKKVSNETGLEPVNRLLGTSFTFDKPYELKRATGCLVYRCQPKEGTGLDNRGHYQYAILDMSSYNNGSAPLHYLEKDSAEAKTTSVSFTINEYGLSYKATIFGRQFITSGLGLGLSSSQADYTEEDDLMDESFSSYYSQELSLEEIIAQELAL